ncbi:LysR substrate-binding domain-containing protein [Albimonas sp. CAU 1670]|uniref:LysR family transcriptional regulator n=1 Tax=Albimonas sp. CAU 1670 TaxID=3032599 RepID=UPI0023DA50DC|nr:LysR family transcriptional regulator [Albimonas sp. CAU 1670]MDF2231736.1 LysR substrate-binding domain-containing protein [Albimonas sp. CAU 1670]
MEMAQVRYVLAAARRLNFTRAAEDCGVSQPALTKGVKALEAELGAPIFLREGRRILLTDFGRSMLSHLQQIADEAEAARRLASSFRLLERAPVRLGVMSTVGHVRLARFLAHFEQRHPGVELSVEEASVPELAERLADAQLDVAVATRTEALTESFRAMELYAERYVVALPPDHRLREVNAVPLSELAGEPYVDRLSCEMREMVMGACRKGGVELYARFRSTREDWVQAMVLAGIGFAFMPEYSVTLPGLMQRPLIEPAVERRICAFTAPGRKHSPGVEALMRAARGFAWPG